MEVHVTLNDSKFNAGKDIDTTIVLEDTFDNNLLYHTLEQIYNFSTI